VQANTTVDAERRRWLETVAAACERLLADPLERDDADGRAVRDGVGNLLARLRAELEAPGEASET
jgi:hypothetical protein